MKQPDNRPAAFCFAGLQRCGYRSKDRFIRLLIQWEMIRFHFVLSRRAGQPAFDGGRRMQNKEMFKNS